MQDDIKIKIAYITGLIKELEAVSKGYDMSNVIPLRKKDELPKDPFAAQEARILDAELAVENMFEKIIHENMTLNEKRRMDRIRRNKKVLSEYNIKHDRSKK